MKMKIASGTLSGGDETVALKCQKVAEGDKGEAGKGKRIVRVSQKYIDILLKEKATCTGMYKPSTSRLTKFLEDYECSVDLRPYVDRLNAIRAEVRAGDEAILEQYHRLGYAYGEVEEENFVNDEKVCGPLATTNPLPNALKRSTPEFI
jgi:hypothetical protein